ncbi:MAG: LacI family DNA-binding transcriptional regulator [Actinomycetota bacterium]
MRPRLNEIAEVASVSPATVSRVLNERPGVASSTRERVLAAAERLGLRRSTPTPGVVGVITPELDNPVFSLQAHTIENRLARLGLLPMLCVATQQAVHEAAYLEHLLDVGVAGLVVVSGRYAEDGADLSLYDPVRRAGVPTVLVNGIDSDAMFPAVCVDERAATVMAVRHLRSLGHERIGCLPGQLRYRSSEYKAEGWGSATDGRHGDLLVETPFTVEGGHAGAMALLDLGATAFTCANDLMALGVIRAVRDRGLSVPDDISVVGYDGTPVTQFTDPALTTVRQPFEPMAAAVTELLVRDHNSAAPKIQFFAPELVVRSSTGACRGVTLSAVDAG